MKIIVNPKTDKWSSLLSRPSMEKADIEKKVKQILARVKKSGDAAVKKYTRDFDKARLDEMLVAPHGMIDATAQVSDELKTAMAIAKNNIETFHRVQQQDAEPLETMPGVKCWKRQLPISKVGLYVPGGTAPLFSTVLMLGIPATLAGCDEITLATPPQKDGTIHPAILFAAQLAGITRIYKAGGAQAIAAMAYGTETMTPVHKIFGPGNQYVTTAKMLVQEAGIAIDMPAGPSELCVLADDTANPAFIAADLLSQAEHGPDSQVLLITTSNDLAKKVKSELNSQLKKLPRKKIIQQALQNSKAIVVKDFETAIQMINEYAPEHLSICCADQNRLASQVKNAGSVFIGPYSPEAAGDYASGTNHALPTYGFARAYSGVQVNSFLKSITYQELSQAGLMNIARTVELMATAEGLEAHANAIRIRLNEKN